MRMIRSRFVAASLCEALALAQDAGGERILPPRRPEGGGYSCGKERT
jgi:hypothetical protein